MIPAFLFLLVVLGAGLCVPRWWRPGEGLAVVGLTPAIGISLVAALASVLWIVGVPAAASAGIVVAISLLGWLKAARQSLRGGRRSAGSSRTWLAAAALLCVAALPLMLASAALYPLEVPLSSQDGAFHTEFVQDRRVNLPRSLVYPPGVHAAMAAVLALLPAVDSAAGVAQIGLVFPALTVLSAIGLAGAATRSVPAALLGGLAFALTWSFPYHPLWWSGWPMAASMLPTLALWTLAILYLRDQRPGLAVVGGVLAGGMVWLHGTEIFTILLGLPVLLAGFARGTDWRRLAFHLAVAAGVALAVVAPFLPDLLWWTSVGGAIAVAQQTQNSTILPEPENWAANFTYWIDQGILSAGHYDFIPRLGLFLYGAWWCLSHRSGRVFLGLFLVFTLKGLLFAYSTHPWVLAIYGVTFPWAILYRLGTVPALCAALVQGIGLAALAGQAWRRYRRSPTNGRARWGLVAAGVAVLVVFDVSGAYVLAKLRGAYEAVYTYSSDDQRAMQWMRTNVSPGQVIANDFLSDAGIWIPFKAGAPILLNFGRAQGQADQREFLRAHISELDTSEAPRQVACELGVQYVYHGARGTLWHPRAFPPLEQLRASAALEEVFASGDAVVFRVNLPCP